MLDVLLFLLEFYDAPFLKTIVFQNVLVLESAADATIGRSPLPSLGWLSCCSASSKVKASFPPGGMVVVQTYTLDDLASLACAHDSQPQPPPGSYTHAHRELALAAGLRGDTLRRLRT